MDEQQVAKCISGEKRRRVMFLVGCLITISLLNVFVYCFVHLNKDTIEDKTSYLFNHGGGWIRIYERFHVGYDFEVSMTIHPLSESGLLLGIRGKHDYLFLEMVDCNLVFSVENGRGPIRTIFDSNKNVSLCDGKSHYVRAIKTKNVVILSVDDHSTNPGIGIPGISVTNTNNGLFIGGHPRQDSLKTFSKKSTRFIGCIYNLVIENSPIVLENVNIRGNVSLNVCL